jgi:hypothetical protein
MEPPAAEHPGSDLDGGGLDPEDWRATRALGHRIVDGLVDWWSSQRERPAWRPMPAEVVERFAAPVPREPGEAASVYREFLRDVLPYPTGTTHPRFFSHAASGAIDVQLRPNAWPHFADRGSAASATRTRSTAA